MAVGTRLGYIPVFRYLLLVYWIGCECSRAGVLAVKHYSESTSTKLSKTVAPPPKSVNLLLVVVFQFTPSLAYLFHHTPSVTTTPRLTSAPTRARARKPP